jgi:hypothetical protein
MSLDAGDAGFFDGEASSLTSLIAATAFDATVSRVRLSELGDV